jgi:hypothetical protein
MKGISSMKNIFLFLTLLVIANLACDLSVTIAPTNNGPATLPTNTVIPTQIPAIATSIPATLAPNATAIGPVISPEGVEVSVGPLSIVLPPRLTYGARGNQIPRAEGHNVSPWEVTPGHTQLKLEGYLLQGKSNQPKIYVYRAQDYAEMYPAAFESIRRIDNILGNNGTPIGVDQLPTVPFYNAKQAFATNIQVISFQSGRGVRFLTEYAQYPVSGNNQDLFYHFQGVTSDGAYYIIAILPITAPVLAESSDAGAVLPQGGIPYPDMNNLNADWQGYYNAITNLLNARSPDEFSPTINKLDLLIQSMRITP